MSYREFQQANEPDVSVEVRSCTCDMHPLPDGRRARYEYEFQVRNVSAKNEDHWTYEVPSPLKELKEEWAKDLDGTLETTKREGKNSHSTLTVRYRKRLEQGEGYTFRFGYECSIRSLVVSEATARNVSLFHWLAYRHACLSQTIRIHLPRGSKLLQSAPPADTANGTLTYGAQNLRPEESFTFFVAYRQFRVGGKFALWTAGSIGSGVVGYLVAYFIGLFGLK